MVGIFGVGFVVGSAMLKHIAPLTWITLKTGERPMSTEYRTLKADALGMVLICIAVYIFWPAFLISFLCYFLSKTLLFPTFRKAAVAAGELIPDIEIKRKTSTEE